MKQCIVRFPRGIRVDIYNPPDDFEKKIQEAFAECTKGTAEDYTYQDKLFFCDQIIERLHKAGDEWEAVKNLLVEKFEYDLENGCDWPDMSYADSIEFMQECYTKGFNDHKMHYQFPDDRGMIDHHIYERIMELEYRAIKAVMDWEPTCGNCAWHKKKSATGGWVCTNEKNEFGNEYTEYGDSCKLWEEK